MASDVDICNLALGYLGDSATVSNLSPPEGSAQAGHCARFYPIARDALLELHPWGFATVRVPLALLNITPPNSWAYAYAAPNDVLNILAVLDPNATDDYSIGLVQPYNVPGNVAPVAGSYTPQTFSAESINGTDVILTNQENAVLRYTAQVTDTTKFPPLFTEALAWSLAAKLAGPLLKGTTGAEMAQSCLKTFRLWYAQATESDANQRRTQVAQRAPWMANR